MTRTDIDTRAAGEQLGLAHVALAVGDRGGGGCAGRALRSRGCRGTRRTTPTGDGYYECVVNDPEGNRVEVTAG